MTCGRNLDDLYRTCFCFEKWGFQYVSMAQITVALLALAQVPAVLSCIMVYRVKPEVTNILKMSVIIIIARFFEAPLLVYRAMGFDPYNSQFESVMITMFCLGTGSSFCAQESIRWGRMLRTSLHATEVLSPERFESYKSMGPPIIITLSVVLTLLFFIIFSAPYVVEEWRGIAIKVVYALAFSSLVVSRCLPIAFMLRERRYVRSLLPQDLPLDFWNDMQRTEFEVVFQFVNVLLIVGISLILVWEPTWVACGGMYFMYVVLPFFFLTVSGSHLGIVRDLFRVQREAKRTLELFHLARQTTIGEYIAEGAHSMEQASSLSQVEAPEVWKRGVSWVFLTSIACSYGSSEDASTREVVEKINPTIEKSGASVWEAVFHSGRDTKALIGESTMMVCHAHSSNFKSLVDILRNHCSKHGHSLSDMYFFIDLFCQVVSGAGQKSLHGRGDQNHILEVTLKAISFPGRMVVPLSPWDQPKTLNRLWCLYELYLAGITHTECHAETDKSCEQAIKEALAGNTNLSAKLMEGVSVQKAEAKDKRDHKMIHASIEGDMGFEAFEDIVVESKLKKLVHKAILGVVLLNHESVVRQKLDGPSGSMEMPLLQLPCHPDELETGRRVGH